MTTTRTTRRRRQSFWGACSILCSVTGTIAFFGGACVHDFAGGDFAHRAAAIALLWACTAAMMLAAVTCIALGMED